MGASDRSAMVDLIEALMIFSKYDSNEGITAAEHDMIYAGPPTANVRSEDIIRLGELGWHVDESEEGFYAFV